MSPFWSIANRNLHVTRVSKSARLKVDVEVGFGISVDVGFTIGVDVGGTVGVDEGLGGDVGV